MKYSLAKYLLTITIPNEIASMFGTSTITIGGLGSMTESINIDVPQDLFTVQGDATGGYVFNRNDNRTGSVQVSLNQLSSKVRQFVALCNIYYSSSEIEEGLTMTVRSTDGTLIATCSDCMPRRIPTQALAATAQNQTWEFGCGKISFN